MLLEQKPQESPINLSTYDLGKKDIPKGTTLKKIGSTLKTRPLKYF